MEGNTITAKSCAAALTVPEAEVRLAIAALMNGQTHTESLLDTTIF